MDFEKSTVELVQVSQTVESDQIDTTGINSNNVMVRGVNTEWWYDDNVEILAAGDFGPSKSLYYANLT